MRIKETTLQREIARQKANAYLKKLMNGERAYNPLSQDEWNALKCYDKDEFKRIEEKYLEVV